MQSVEISLNKVKNLLKPQNSFGGHEFLNSFETYILN
jgi:hypothetical protein